MNEAELKEMKEDRLANFAVTAFLGSLLMGQAWGMWEGSERTTNLLMFTVPDYSGLVILALLGGFFVLALFLTAASMVTPLQRWGLPTTFSVAPIMLPIVWVSFTFSWLSSTLELPDDQWWTPVLFVGGFGMFLFIGFRRTLASLFGFLHQRVRTIAGYGPVGASNPDCANDGEACRPHEQATLLERMRKLRGHLRLTKSGSLWVSLLVFARNQLKNFGSSTARMWSHFGGLLAKARGNHTWAILDYVMSALGAAMGTVAGYAVGFWLIPYLVDPDHPYVGGSLFTLAQVVAIFGAFGVAAGFSNYVEFRLRNTLRAAGALHIMSALGFTLLGMMLPVSTSEAMWTDHGDVLTVLNFVALAMAIMGFWFGTTLWVSRFHRLLGIGRPGDAGGDSPYPDGNQQEDRM